MRGLYLSEPDRPKQCNNQQPNGCADDDGEGGSMQDVIPPLLILGEIGLIPHAGLDQHERGAAQSALNCGLQSQSLLSTISCTFAFRNDSHVHLSEPQHKVGLEHVSAVFLV